MGARTIGIALGVLGLAAPVAAQSTLTAVTLAEVALDVCLQDNLPIAAPDVPAAFSEEMRTETSVAFVHPDGARLTLGTGAESYSCEIVVPDAGRPLFDALAAQLSPAIQERFDLVEPQGVETGLVWDVVLPDGHAITSELALTESGDVRFTSITQTDAAERPPARREN